MRDSAGRHSRRALYADAICAAVLITSGLQIAGATFAQAVGAVMALCGVWLLWALLDGR